MASTKETNSSATRANTKPQQQTLHSQYPITSTWEVTLQNGETVKGEIYCTDPLANLIVLQDQLGDIRMVSVASILESKQLKEPSEDEVVQASSMAHNRKALEEREKRAIRLAQESILHLNPKASPKGQVVFDRLLKACNEVVWKGESIIVLSQIQVDPPYSQEDCKLLHGTTQSGGSLDRVQKIVVASAPSAS